MWKITVKNTIKLIVAVLVVAALILVVFLVPYVPITLSPITKQSKTSTPITVASPEVKKSIPISPRVIDNTVARKITDAMEVISFTRGNALKFDNLIEKINNNYDYVKVLGKLSIFSAYKSSLNIMCSVEPSTYPESDRLYELIIFIDKLSQDNLKNVDLSYLMDGDLILVEGKIKKADVLADISRGYTYMKLEVDLPQVTFIK